MNPIVMAILTTRPIEDLVGWLLYNNRAHDSGLTTRSPTISSTPKTLSLTSPDVGPSGSPLSTPYASSQIGGSNKIPSLTWSSPEDLKPKIAEYLLLCEDPDAPMPEPIVHGIYLGINKSKTSTTQADFEVEDESAKMLKGDFMYGRSRSGAPYIAPRPIMRHGEHRYFWSVVGLGERVDWEEIRRGAGEQGVGKEEVLKAVEGKVVAWGEWDAHYGRGR